MTLQHSLTEFQGLEHLTQGYAEVCITGTRDQEPSPPEGNEYRLEKRHHEISDRDEENEFIRIWGKSPQSVACIRKSALMNLISGYCSPGWAHRDLN